MIPCLNLKAPVRKLLLANPDSVIGCFNVVLPYNLQTVAYYHTMTSIGPQIPHHLLRKAKGKEIDDEEPGPQPQGSRVPDTPSIGPHIPANALSQVLVQHASRPGSTYNNDDDDDDYVPELPPDLVASRSGTSVSDNARPEAGPSTGRQERRVLGPSLPGHVQQAYGDDGDSDEGDYGPMPSMQRTQHSDTVSEGVREFLEKEEKRKKEIEVCLRHLWSSVLTDFFRKLQNPRN